MTDDSPFRMPIEAVFALKGRGTIVSGRVESGSLRKGDPIVISGGTKPEVKTRVTAFAGFIRDPDSWVATAGDNTGIVLHEVEASQLEAGMIVTSG